MASPLYNAIKANDLETARRLLAEDPTQVNKLAYKHELISTNFQYAVEKGSPEMIKLLIENGADLEKPYMYGDWQPLTMAVAKRKPEIVKILLDAGAKVNEIIDKKLNATALHFIGGSDRRSKPETYEMLDLLISAGADVNNPPGGSTLLHNSKDPVIVKRLLDAGANVNAVNKLGETPLSVNLGRPAFDPTTINIIQLLLENGADVKIHVKGKSIYETALGMRHLPDRVKALIEEYKDHPTWLRRRHALAAFGAAGGGRSTATRHGGRRKRYRRRSLKSQRR